MYFVVGRWAALTEQSVVIPDSSVLQMKFSIDLDET